MGWKDKLKTLWGKESLLTDSFFEELSDMLIEGDFGAKLALKTVDDLESFCKKEKIRSRDGAKERLDHLLQSYLEGVYASCGDNFLAAPPDGCQVTLVLGVNGVGKTTSAAKLAALYKKNGAKPLLAAADTFRAAAIDQLKIHGERLDIRVVAHRQNADAAAVVHDALAAAEAGGYTHVVVDTAGRMHTKAALVNELVKIHKVIERFSGASSKKVLYKKVLVLDATTGTNALFQAETFHNAVKLDGAVLTKYDSSARGGIVFPLAVEFRLPVLLLCDGEKYEDIHLFDYRAFVSGFLL